MTLATRLGLVAGLALTSLGMNGCETKVEVHPRYIVGGGDKTPLEVCDNKREGTFTEREEYYQTTYLGKMPVSSPKLLKIVDSVYSCDHYYGYKFGTEVNALIGQKEISGDGTVRQLYKPGDPL